MQKMVRAKVSFATGYQGGTITVQRGQRLSADHEIVARFPAHFEPDGDAAPVEQTTAAPGEVRATRRARRKP